jgi:tRNA A-37 threonylcarbamoyl transferase component Bud32/GAF domain-containing protein
VFAATETASGDLWLGTLRGAARLGRGPQPRVVEVVGEADGLANALVFRAETGPDGSLWVWSEGGLQRRRPGEARLGPVDEFTSAIGTDVWAFAFDGASRLWVGSRREEGGLAARGPDGSWKVFDRLPDGTRLGIAHAVAPRRAGGVWAAFGSRVGACDGETVSLLPDPPAAMSRPYVNKLFEDGKGRLWAASGSGLARLEPDGRWALLTDRLGSPYVYFVGEDRTGTVWVGTTRGVYRLGAGDAVTPFTPDDGLAGWETNMNAFRCDRDGVVWIGTVAGLSRYDPASQRPNAHPPRVVVASALLPTRTVPFPDRLELAWSERSVAFRVAVLSFRARGRTGYRARLEGLEEGWLPTRREPELRYTNLPAGELRLLVQGINESGLWGGVETLPILVRPPFWLTPWFRAAALVALAAVVAGTFRWRTLLLRRRNRELERVVAERTTDLASANRSLRNAQEEIARLLESSPAPSENVASWSQSLARDVASAIGAERIGIWEVRDDDVLALSDAGLAPPSIEELRAGVPGWPRTPGPEGAATVVPVAGMSSELRGALLVEGPALAWGETEMRLVGGFAHQLGAALDMAHMRRQLAALREKREATLREMHDQGIATLQLCPRCGLCFDQTAESCPADGAPLEAPRPLPYELLGRYRFERLLGQGGMATVFSARDVKLARDVAIKLVRPEHFGDAELRARFEREARAIARITHPGVIALFDSGELPDGTAFLVMEKLRGHDLSHYLLECGPGTPRQVASLARQAGAALAAAHAAGVVHRDVKPANLFLADDAAGFRVRVLDFGLAKSMAHEKGLTRTGMVVGTPEYMSPEQVSGEEVDARSDVYALGAVCYEALVGRRAIRGEDLGRILANVLDAVPEPASSILPGVPAEASDALAAALAKERSLRPADVAAWAAAFATALEQMPEGITPGWKLVG